MSELTKEQLEQDARPIDPLAHMFDSIFGKRLADADAQSRKIAEAARSCREVEDEERDDTRAEECEAWLAARAENDGAQP